MVSAGLNESGVASSLINSTLETESDLILPDSKSEKIQPTIGDTVGIDVPVEKEQQLTDKTKPEKKKIKLEKIVD